MMEKHCLVEVLHFGYKDGISQPTIAGAPKSEFPDSQSPIPSGAFLQGIQSPSGQIFVYSVPRPRELGRNGSFVAFRILEQDVAAFNQYLKDTTARLKETYPKINMDEEGSRAKLCGRWRNGAALSCSPLTCLTPKDRRRTGMILRMPMTQEGYRCPFGAHMRRTNLRGESEKRRRGLTPTNTPSSGAGCLMVSRMIPRTLTSKNVVSSACSLASASRISLSLLCRIG